MSSEADLRRSNPCLCVIPRLMLQNSGKKWKTSCERLIPMAAKAPEPTLPGEDLVQQGLADLAQDKLTDCSLLLLVAAPRLRSLGLDIPDRPTPTPYHHLLYERLEERLGTAAHS